MRKVLGICILLLVFLPVFVSAATINAASCSQTDVQAAVNSAADGDTVQIPAGSCTWASVVTVSLSAKSLIMRGAGTAPTMGSANETTITDKGFNIITALNKQFRLTNVKLAGNGDTYGALVTITGTGRPPTGGFRIDHISFDNVCFTGDCRAMRIDGYTYGVIDHNIGESYGQFSSITELIVNNGNFDCGNTGWQRSQSLGTINSVYLEDNDLQCGYKSGKLWMIADGTGGSRIVARHNNLTDYYFGGHDAITGDWRSNMQWEMYDNIMYVTKSYSGGVFSQRGGTGVVFNNKIITTVDAPFYEGQGLDMTNYRSCYNGGQSPWNTWCDSIPEKACTGRTNHCANACTTDADCDGIVGACQQVDSNIDGTGYACRDQIGRSANQSLLPALFWNNTLKIMNNPETKINPYIGNTCTSGATCRTECSDPSFTATFHIKLNRDYCQDNNAMPASCNGITSTYSPYVYPHPFITDCADYPIMCDSGSSPPPVAVPGDLNGDRKVDISDLVIVASNFGKTSGFDVRANVVSSTSEVIDIADLSFVARRFTG